MFIRNTKRHVCCQIISFVFCSIKYNMKNVESKNAILKIIFEIVIFELKQENKTHAFMRLHISTYRWQITNPCSELDFFFLNAIISCILLNCAHSSYWVDAIGSLLLKWYRETGKKAFERCVSIQIIGLLLLWLCEHWLQINFIRKSVCAQWGSNSTDNHIISSRCDC